MVTSAARLYRNHLIFPHRTAAIVSGDSSSQPDSAGSVNLFPSFSDAFTTELNTGDGRFGGRALFTVGDTDSRMSAVVHAALLLLGALVAANVFIVLGVSLLDGIDITEQSTPVLYDLSTSALQFLAFIGVSLWYLLWRSDGLVGLRVPTRSDLLLIVGGTLALIAVMLSLEILMDLLGFETAENVTIDRGQAHPELFLLLIPMQFLFTGPAEELLFRGIIQGLFRRAYGIIPGILLAGAVFSLFHIPALGGGEGVTAVLLILFISGSLLGVLYEYSGNIIVPIVAHAVWNALVFGNQYVQAVGMV